MEEIVNGDKISIGKIVLRPYFTGQSFCTSARSGEFRRFLKLLQFAAFETSPQTEPKGNVLV